MSIQTVDNIRDEVNRPRLTSSIRALDKLLENDTQRSFPRFGLRVSWVT